MKLFGMSLMPQSLGLALVATLMTLTTACSPDLDQRKVSGDVSVRLPWMSDDNQYSFQDVLLKGLSSVTELSGTYVKFYIAPSIKNNKLSGNSPKTRFVKVGGTYVPADTLTQQIATIYAHMQRLSELDAKVGAENVNTFPRDVGVQTRMVSDGTLQSDNAFYEGETDSMLILPYTEENLPIPINAGILAHEYF
ncbi:MAG: hypothetical protein EOP06_12995, partial [Proteobacteria bacterium]